MRPTGKLHLGNYMGALANWVKLEKSGQYECYFFVADWHALTTDYADPSRIKLNTLDVALDWLAAGLDPEKSTIFIQSHVLQHAELNLLLGMMTPLGWLERVPTYKEQQENLSTKDLTNFGFLGYPVLMASDILLYQAQFVPVGQDQSAHVELTRETARRFNSMYKTAVFPEPDALFTPSPKLTGTDGRKMSKSYGNTIGLTEATPSVAAKIASMSTNGQRLRQTDPGDPDLCPVGDLHKVFSAPEVIEATRTGCRTASLRCEFCKAEATKSVCSVTGPIYDKRMQLESNIEQTWEMLRAQSIKAAARAEETMREVRDVFDLSHELGFVKQYFQAKAQIWLHNLESHFFDQNWEHRPEAEQKKSIRTSWIQLVKRDAHLKFEANRSFDSVEREIEEPAITPKGKRVFVDSNRIYPAKSLDQVWHFAIPQKSFEVWVLLNLNENRETKLLAGDSYVIPQRYFSQPFAKAKKSLRKDEKIPVSLRKDGDRFLLSIHGSEPVDVTALRGNYEPLQ
jgi:tryptophanyl-tRNA synthetase